MRLTIQLSLPELERWVVESDVLDPIKWPHTVTKVGARRVARRMNPKLRACGYKPLTKPTIRRLK